MSKATWKLTTQESYINSSSKHKGAIQKTCTTQLFSSSCWMGLPFKNLLFHMAQNASNASLALGPLPFERWTWSCQLAGQVFAGLQQQSVFSHFFGVLKHWHIHAIHILVTMVIFTKLESLQLLTHQNGIRVAEDCNFSSWSKSFKALYGIMANFTFLKVTTWLFWSSLAFAKVPMGHKTSSPAPKAFLPDIPKRTKEKTKLALWNKGQIQRHTHKNMLLLISQPRNNKALQDAGQK